jgi:hypothetical protein
VPKPYPKEFRDDVVRVARNREPGVHLKQIAADLRASARREWLIGPGQGGICVCPCGSFESSAKVREYA